MSQREKLLKRLLSKPKDFTWDELVKLMAVFDYKINNKGKTSGSAVVFESEDSDQSLYLHKPHPKEILKRWHIEKTIDFLSEIGVVKKE